MGVVEDFEASGVPRGNREAAVNFTRTLPVNPDRREGLLRLWMQGQGLTPTLTEIERARGT